MMRRSLAPAAAAASTNSFSRSDRKRPRTMRARVTQSRNARMSPIFIGCGIVTVIGPSETSESLEPSTPRRSGGRPGRAA